VPGVAVDLRVGRRAGVVQQRKDDLARTRRRKTPVGRKTGDEETGPGARQRRRQIAVVGVGGIEVVERLGHHQIGIGVEEAGELVALIAQVGLDLEIDVVAELVLAMTQLPAKFLGHLAIRQIGDVADHARQPQAPGRDDAMLGVVTAVEIGIGDDRLPCHLVEGDVLRRQLRRRSDHHRVPDAIRKLQRPFERLHAAEAAADHCRPGLDAQMIGQPCLCRHPVLDRHHREIGAVALAGFRIDRQRTRRTIATTQVVDADDKELPGIERLSRADEVVPPADVLRIVGIGRRPRGGSRKGRGKPARRWSARH
jgi:hypothetical protein